MSSLSGSAIGGGKVPTEGEKEDNAPEMSPPASRKRGRPKGSHNKKTLEALAARAATAPSTFVAPQATGAPGNAGVPERRGPGRPKGSGRKTAPAAAAAPSSSRQEMAYAKLQECSGGQPTYRVEVYYDDQGVCYFHDGWSKFFIDYGAHEGWFILLTR
jgi:hypothetical protein